MAVSVQDPPVRRKAAASPGPDGPDRRMGLLRRIRRDGALLLLMVPGVVYFLVFHYAAMFGNVIACKDYIPFIGIYDSVWVGFGNFEVLFADPAFWRATVNTVVLSLAQLIFSSHCRSRWRCCCTA